MRTKQGTPRGYTECGFVAYQGCRGWRLLDKDCDASLDGPGLTPAEAKRGVKVLILTPAEAAHLGEKDRLWRWLCTPAYAQGRLCVECAKAWRAQLEVWRAAAVLEELCGACGATRGRHTLACPHACGGAMMCGHCRSCRGE